MPDQDQTTRLIVLGASGDLFTRLLLPGLGALVSGGGRSIELIGTGRSERDQQEWREGVTEALAAADLPESATRELVDGSRWVTGDPTEAATWTDLLDGVGADLMIHAALPPAVYADLLDTLAEVELPDRTVLALEKPFGTDAASARDLAARAAGLELDLFGVDHFLGTPAVLNLLGLRFANRLLAEIWRAEHVAAVEVVWDETLGLEGRAGFYDSTGALVDMIQSHLLLVAGLVAMEPPARLEGRDLHEQLRQVLEVTRVLDDDPAEHTRRGRYRGYLDEDGVDPTHDTETLAEVTLEVDTARWQGVPFRLRTAKAIGAERCELVLWLRPTGHPMDGVGGTPDGGAVRLDLRSGDLTLDLVTNGRGDPFHLERSTAVSELGDSRLPPYGEVLRAALDGDDRLSVPPEVSVRCWEIVEPVRRSWRAGVPAMEEYPAGS